MAKKATEEQIIYTGTWDYSGKLDLPSKEADFANNAIKHLNNIIKIQKDREKAFFTKLGLKQVPETGISVETLKNMAGLLPEVTNTFTELYNNLEQYQSVINPKNNSNSASIEKIDLSSIVNSTQFWTINLYNSLKNYIESNIKSILKNNSKEMDDKEIAQLIVQDLQKKYDELIKNARDLSNKAEAEQAQTIINNSFNKVFAIFAKQREEIFSSNANLQQFLAKYANYQVSNVFRELETSVQEAHKAFEDSRKEDAAKIFMLDAKIVEEKFIISNQNGTSTLTINFGAIIKSVKSSISGIVNNLKGPGLEQMITKAIQNNMTVQTLGEVPANFRVNAEATGSRKSSGGAEWKTAKNANKATKRIAQLKNEALKYGRNVKADVFLSFDDQTFGISAKAGQENAIKLDTRGSFYSFLNFIGHYKKGKPIAKALEQPSNINAILSQMTEEGHTVSFPELTQALKIIAYSFFGFVDEKTTTEDLMYFYTQGTTDYSMQNNAVIITDRGDIKRISPYLEAIKTSIQNETMKTLNTTFSVDDKQKEAYKMYGLGAKITSGDSTQEIPKSPIEAMRYVTVMTTLSQ